MSRATIQKDNITFDRKIAMVLTWSDNNPVLHIVDIEKGFHKSVLIREESETCL